MEKETRRLLISKRVFTKADILRLGQAIDKEYQTAKSKKFHSSLSYQLFCKGGISYESDSLETFGDGGPLDIKKTLSIEMYFSDYENERRIMISLREGNIDNYLYVTGTDKNWVQGTFTNLLEILESVKPQDSIILRHKSLVFHVISFGIGTLVYLFITKLINPLIPPIQNPSDLVISIATFFSKNLWLMFVIDIILRWTQGLFFALIIRDWLFGLWPDIEFDFGPDHMNSIKVRRQRVWSIVSMVVIPILIDIFVN